MRVSEIKKYLNAMPDDAEVSLRILNKAVMADDLDETVYRFVIEGAQGNSRAAVITINAVTDSSI